MLERLITPAQLKALQTIFSRKGWDTEERHGFIQSFTYGRTASAKELTMTEAKQLLTMFGVFAKEECNKQTNDAKKVLGSIYHLSLKIDFLNKGYTSDTKEERQMNYAKINKFCRERSAVKKNVQDMSLMELQAVKRQLESIARKQ